MSITQGQNAEASDFIIEAVLGDVVSTRSAVYIKTSDGKAYLTDADDIATIGFAGFCIQAGTVGDTIGIRHDGNMNGFSGLTTNANYYLSATAGEITTTKPSNYKFVGQAISASVLKLRTITTVRRRVYTTNSTWTKPGGLVYVDVELVGGGGGGGGHNNSGAADNPGGGGGGGGYSRKTIYAGDLAATESATVGLGGSGGAGGADDATDGGTSSFGSHLQATGGAKGRGGSISGKGGTGGVGSNGDVNMQGGAGGATGGSVNLLGGAGGDSMLGGGASGGNGTGETGGNYGGGGSGGGGSAGSSQAGGAGAPGVVIVTEYY